MPAMFGSTGTLDGSFARRMAMRMASRGTDLAEWSLAPDVHVGQVRDNGLALGIGAQSLLLDGFVLNAGSGDAVSALLDGYRERGPSFFARLNGHFAVALWDAARRCLILARDRYGVVPLFHSRVGGVRLFATEAKTLLAIDEIPAVADPIALQEFNYSGWVPRGRSFLQDIHSVPAGTVVELFEDGEAIHPFSLPPAPPSRAGFEAHVEAVRSGFETAMERYAQKAGSIGVALSSGIDSAYVLAALQRARPGRPIHSFSVGYGKKDPEMMGARETAAELGSVHHEIIVRPKDLRILLPEAIWHLEDPVGRDQYPCVLALSKTAKSYVDTLFFGNGADQLFGGLPVHPWLYGAKRFPWLRPSFEDYLSYMKSSRPPRTRLGHILVAALGERRLPEPAKIFRSEGNPHIRLREASEPHALSAFLENEIRVSQGHAGWKYQLVTSASRLNVRMPFYDEDLITLARTLPDDFKQRWFRGKYGLRVASRSILSRTSAWRPKRIQHLCFDEEFSAVLDAWADELLSPDMVAARGIYAPGEVARIRRSSGNRPYTPKHLYRLWYLIAVEIWARLFIDGRGKIPTLVGTSAAAEKEIPRTVLRSPRRRVVNVGRP